MSSTYWAPPQGGTWGVGGTELGEEPGEGEAGVHSMCSVKPHGGREEAIY